MVELFQLVSKRFLGNDGILLNYYSKQVSLIKDSQELLCFLHKNNNRCS